MAAEPFKASKSLKWLLAETFDKNFSHKIIGQKMRDAIKQVDWHCYGLREDDFEAVVRITSEMIADRFAAMKQIAAQTRNENPKHADDILDDVLYYKGLETYYLWECCIVRLIGIFEGAIERNFLPAGRYTGYTSRIKALEECGYIFALKNEIKEWVQLRNALAHSPPENFRPAMINEADARECCDLLTRSFCNLKNQKNTFLP